jgi:hypothetical protein
MAADFLLIAIAKRRLPEDDCAHSPPVDFYALDSV